MTAAQKKQRPLIRYAGSAAETSIGSKPIGSELNARVYPERPACQAALALAQTLAYLPRRRLTWSGICEGSAASLPRGGLVRVKRYAARVDGNQAEIVNRCRALDEDFN